MPLEMLTRLYEGPSHQIYSIEPALWQRHIHKQRERETKGGGGREKDDSALDHSFQLLVG